MHAQRCPVAKFRAASQQNSEALGQVTKHRSTKTSILPSVIGGVTESKKKQEKTRRGQRSQSAKSQERPSFFQKLHGDAAPLLPPRPQMYSDETWKSQHSTVPPVTHQVYYNEAAHKLMMKKSGNQTLIYNENCAIHGRNTSRQYGISKSVSCPSTSRPQSRQNVSGERLKNWRRNSMTFTATSQGHSDRTVGNMATHRTISSGQNLQSLVPVPNQKSGPHTRTPSSMSSSLSSANPSSISLVKSNTAFDDAQNRRSQFRRAWSLFSIGCDEVEKEKLPPQRILRQPTRYVYRRGISGLPIECTNRHLGIAF
ncbi:uncharacterized protein LOC121875756 [Homarus americanus]|uniref:DUF4797 domain-containing protein n=1 Tax=Homarus americanus TaxID=6706 RepID=A0A8J5MR65_HOMAM|nr:uncharacterized protein LOC121875756 [Homarus americanus]XP_042236375.1 uncharacterized protein LOC121875756 [Homarus americanus]KAG7160895.1 hypothetical protein Hamer_G007668 [Homarus americanus]